MYHLWVIHLYSSPPIICVRFFKSSHLSPCQNGQLLLRSLYNVLANSSTLCTSRNLCPLIWYMRSLCLLHLSSTWLLAFLCFGHSIALHNPLHPLPTRPTRPPTSPLFTLLYILSIVTSNCLLICNLPAIFLHRCLLITFPLNFASPAMRVPTLAVMSFHFPTPTVMSSSDPLATHYWTLYHSSHTNYCPSVVPLIAHL